MTWQLNQLQNRQTLKGVCAVMSMAHVAFFKTRIMPMKGFPGT